MRLSALSGIWETCGVDRLRGIVPEGITFGFNDWGPDKAGFTLRRDPAGIWPDLAAFTPVEIEIGGVVCWTGRVSETPTRDGSESVISVECEGWQYHLDDTVYKRSYVHTRPADWQNATSFIDTNLANYTTGWQIDNGEGGIRLALPAGNTAASGKACSVILDTGETAGAKRIVLTYTSGAKAGLALYVANAASSPTGEDELVVFDASPILASNTAGQTFTTARRYVEILLSNQSGAAMTGDETSWVQIQAAQVFRDTAYESGNASILKADTVAKDARDQAAPLLSTSNDRVEAQTFSIPEFSMDSYRTPREVLQAINAYEDCLVGVDINKKLFFREKPTVPLLELGAWTGGEMEDAAANSGDDIYNTCIVEGTGPDGQPLTAIRTQTGTLVNRRGFERTKILSVAAAGTSGSYNQIGDLFLAAHRTTPMRGSAKAAGPAAIRKVLGGETVHPSRLGLYIGELLRLSHRIDPDTGGHGRDVRMVATSYTHDDETCTVDLDARRSNFEALLERLAIVTGQF